MTEPLEIQYEVDRVETINYLVKKVIGTFPSATGDLASFLKANKKFIDRLLKMSNISSELEKHCEKMCPKCKDPVLTWSHKTKDSFLVTSGELKKINVTVKTCSKCKILIYADLLSFGLVPVHNKEIIVF